MVKISNTQFRRVGSANAGVPKGSTSMKVPKTAIRIKRNARSGRKFSIKGL